MAKIAIARIKTAEAKTVTRMMVTKTRINTRTNSSNAKEKLCGWTNMPDVDITAMVLTRNHSPTSRYSTIPYIYMCMNDHRLYSRMYLTISPILILLPSLHYTTLTNIGCHQISWR